MKKIALALFISLTSFLSVKAQKSDFHFEGGLRLGLPVGIFGDVYSFGAGVDLQGEYMFSPMVSGTITTGYTSFFGKTISDGFGNTYKVGAAGYIPVLVGARVYPAESFFVGARFGLGFLTGSSTGNSFNYEPQVGYNGGNIQLALGYNSLTPTGGSLSHLSLTALYKFN